jgi:hypothetical protein
MDRTIGTAVLEWLSAFSHTLESGNAASCVGLFEQGDCYWRDLLAFTWTIRTLEGPGAIDAMLKETIHNVRPTSFKLIGSAKLVHVHVTMPKFPEDSHFVASDNAPAAGATAVAAATVSAVSECTKAPATVLGLGKQMIEAWFMFETRTARCNGQVFVCNRLCAFYNSPLSGGWLRASRCV